MLHLIKNRKLNVLVGSASCLTSSIYVLNGINRQIFFWLNLKNPMFSPEWQSENARNCIIMC